MIKNHSENNDTIWDEVIEYLSTKLILHHVVDTISNGEKDINFPTSLIIPKDDGTMVSKSFFGFEDREFYGSFRWRDPINGLAGLCAAMTKDIYIISNLNTQGIKEAIHFIEFKNEIANGILAIPLTTIDMKCEAVISISCDRADYLNKDHLQNIQPLIKEIQEFLLQKHDDISRWYNDHRIITDHDILMGLEQRATQLPDLSGNEPSAEGQTYEDKMRAIFDDFIDDLESKPHAVAKSHYEDVWSYIIADPFGEVELDDLILFFDGKDKAKVARNFISRFNQRLQEFGAHEERETMRLVRKTKYVLIPSDTT